MHDPKLHQIYKHYKGDFYIIENFATHSETGEELVIYRALYGDGKLWARPRTIFLEELDPATAAKYQQKYRFELQIIASKAGH